MTIKEINETYDMLSSEIYAALDLHINPKDNSIVYELSQDNIDENNYDYWVDVPNRHGSPYTMAIQKVYKNGNIIGYLENIDEKWDGDSSDIYDMGDKLTILNILSNDTN